MVTRTLLMSYTPESLRTTGPQRLLGIPYFSEILSHLSPLKAESIIVAAPTIDAMATNGP